MITQSCPLLQLLLFMKRSLYIIALAFEVSDVKNIINGPIVIRLENNVAIKTIILVFLIWIEQPIHIDKIIMIIFEYWCLKFPTKNNIKNILIK